MCPHKEWLDDYEEKAGGNVLMGNDAPCKTVSIGSVKIRMHDGVVRTLTNVRHVPDLKKNLISVGALDAKGFVYCVEGGMLQVKKVKPVVMQRTRQGNLYILQGATMIGNSSSVSQSEASNNPLWHMRLGHMSERGMEILCKRGLLGNLKMEALKFCEHCVYGKQHRLKFPKGVHTAKATLDLVHADCCGPSKVPSLGGVRYFLSFIDDYSRKTRVFMMKQKSEAFQNFKHWTVLMQNQTGKKVKRLRTDNGLEFCSKEFNNFYNEEGIARQHTIRHTPQQNEVAKRMNRTLLERARCMLSNAHLDASFWAEVVNTACYLVNLSPSTVNGFKTPVEVWSDQLGDYSILKVFGCLAYNHVM